MQGRFNLNNLRHAEREATKAFERSAAAPLSAHSRAGRHHGRLARHRIRFRTPEGAEDGTYLSQNPPYRAANGLVTTTTEMLALPGMTRDEFERIRPYVAALPVGTTINLCTAKAPVLAALITGRHGFRRSGTARPNRKDGCFPTERSSADLERLELATISDIVERKSDWFRAVTAVRIGTSEFTLYSLIERNGSTAIRTVLRSTGTE